MSESAQTTVEKEQAESPLLFQREGVPSLKDLLPCSLQHVLACFAGAIAPAMMIASTCTSPSPGDRHHPGGPHPDGLGHAPPAVPALRAHRLQPAILTGVSFAFLPAFQASASSLASAPSWAPSSWVAW